MRIGDTTSAAAAAVLLATNPRPVTVGGAGQAAQTGFGEAVVIPPELWKRFEKAKASLAKILAMRSPSEPDNGAFRPDKAGLSVTGGGFVSANVAGAEARTAFGDAKVSLRLDGSASRLDGAMSGAAEIGLHMDTYGGPADTTAHLRVRTGEGKDTVSLSMGGGVRKHVDLHTNGGDDVISITGAEASSIGVHAGDGDDTVSILGNGGSRVLHGDAGDDVINLHNGSGFVSGGAGDDRIHLSWDSAAGAPMQRTIASRSTACGGAQTTRQMMFTANVATVLFGRGGGQDVVTTGTRGGAQAQERAAIRMSDFRADEVEAVRDGADLVLRVRGTEDSLTLRDYDPGAWGLIMFRDGACKLSDLAGQAARLDTAV